MSYDPEAFFRVEFALWGPLHILSKIFLSFFFESKTSNIYLSFDDKDIFKSLGNFFRKSINTTADNQPRILSDEERISALQGAAELIFKGWHKEAIPFINKKKSIISSFFSRFF